MQGTRAAPVASMRALQVLLAIAIGSRAGEVPCVSDEECSLNGICSSSGYCLCDPGWITLPYGPNNSMSPGCGYLDFLPAPISACGDGCAFHGGQGGVDRTSTSWGGSVIQEEGKYWMFAAEMSNHCTLGQWTTNSQVAGAVSDTPLGPFVRQGVAIPPWAHNPQIIKTPDGKFVIYTLGPGLGLKKQQNCSKSSNAPAASLGRCRPPEQDTDFNGNDLAPACGLKAPDAHECCALCVNHTHCSAYTFMPATNTCCLKTAGAAGARAMPSYQSGVVRPPPPTTVNFTVHSSDSPLGPWKATTMQVTGWNASWTLQNPGNWNPAPMVFPNGSVRVMAHTDWAPWAGQVILAAESWEGPYTVLGSDLIDHCAYCEEDGFMWIDQRGNWHVLYHRMFDPVGALDPNWGQEDGTWHRPANPVPSPGWAGGHAFSRDGLTWSKWSRCYNTSVTLTDGRVVETNRRERPKLLFDKSGTPTHLYNGAIWPNETYTIVTPLNVPANQ